MVKLSQGYWPVRQVSHQGRGVVGCGALPCLPRNQNGVWHAPAMSGHQTPLQAHDYILICCEHLASLSLYLLPNDEEMEMDIFKDAVSRASSACRSCAQQSLDWLHNATRPQLYVITAGLLLLIFLWRAVRNFRRPLTSRRRSPDPEKRSIPAPNAACKEPGIWIPDDFKRPDPSPYPDWDVHTTKPLPYRPFRYGPYHITLGLRSIKWEDWIEIDNQFLKFHNDKVARIEERGPRLSKTAPEAMDGAYELLEEFCDYLPKRYPSLFRKTAVGMDNLLTNESFNIVERPLKEDPMQMAGRMVQDDLAIMFEKPDGQYYLLAGSIIVPGFWRLEDKFGMRLSEIHTSGNVPGFKTKLEKGMMNFFRRVKPDALTLRHNYSIQIDDNLAWSHSIGKEDDAGHGNGGDGEHTAKTGWTTAERNKAVEHHWFRSERQSLRRLPRSGGVVFTIRTYFHPIMEIAEEPGVPGRLASGVRSWDQDTARYKGQEVYQDVLLEYLDRKHKEQVEKGVVAEDGEQPSNYPW
jgi:Protein of unknown function (DUF3445)